MPELSKPIERKLRLWKTGIHHSQNYSSMRPYRSIMSLHRLKLRDLQGKRVLDVAAGHSDFRDVLRKKGIDAYSLDPNYDIQKIDYTEHIQETKIPDESFDVVLSSIMNPFFGEQNKFVQLSILYQMIRITKADGFVSIFPIPKDNFIERIAKVVRKCGFDVYFHYSDSGQSLFRVYRKKNSNIKLLEKTFGINKELLNTLYENEDEVVW